MQLPSALTRHPSDRGATLQVSAAQLGTLAKLAAGTLDASDRMSSDEGGAAGGQAAELAMEDFRCEALPGAGHVCLLAPAATAARAG